MGLERVGMAARLLGLALCGILVSSLLIAGGSRSLTQSVDVVVLANPISAEFGTTVQVIAYVFDRGALAEPLEINAHVNRLPGITPLVLVRQSVGVFEGAFVFQSHPTIIVVNATVGATRDSGAATVYNTYDSSPRIIPSKGIASPGQTIAIAVEAPDREGLLQDVDSLDLTARVFSSPWYESLTPPTALNWTWTGVGQYSAVYTVPANIDRDAVVILSANVVRGGHGSGIGSNVYVDFPDTFQVWYRTGPVKASNATLEINVASPSGGAASNVTVSVRVSPHAGEVAPILLEGTTGPAGAVRFEVPLASIPAYFLGNVTDGFQRQSFQGSLGFPALPEILTLLRENQDEIFQPGEAAVLRFRLLRGSQPTPDQELYVYGQTRSDVVVAERVRTNSEGRFEVRFVAPAEGVNLEVSGLIDATWRVFTQSFLALNRLAATVSSLDGWRLTVTGRFPNDAGPWIGHLGLSAVEEAFASPRIAAGSFGAHRLFEGFGGQRFALDVSLPRFLPAGQTVFLSIWAESFRGAYHEYHVTVIAGTPISVPRPIDVAVLALLLGFGIWIAMSIIGWPWRRPPPGGWPPAKETSLRRR
jgi:hypothetical protein